MDDCEICGEIHAAVLCNANSTADTKVIDIRISSCRSFYLSVVVEKGVQKVCDVTHMKHET
jgi:hypothetical protein